MMDLISLPKTCFSCQHYQQTGWKEDIFAKKKDNDGLPIKTKKQRVGQCTQTQSEVFWNERCNEYLQESGITTHPCSLRPTSSN
ncbi:hypothetical protein A6D98_09885 [Aliivibrio fischeri]|uniref:hypothetical protein n=1 Tax=Aliivibrio fischeri TaxID=668 RepID=UPI00080DB89C|nr:hypothetical protein [Aliivibrio fischeri]OCH60900.1 hypothetical protein A6D98_09885 [Aliivibrio fischeri]